MNPSKLHMTVPQAFSAECGLSSGLADSFVEMKTFFNRGSAPASKCHHFQREPSE